MGLARSQSELVCDDVDGVADDRGQVCAVVGAELGGNVASQCIGVGTGVEFEGGEGSGTVEHDSGVGRVFSVWSK